MRRATLLLPALLLLAACGGEDPAPAAESTSAAPTSSSAAATVPPAAGVDRTAELQATAGDVVTAATQDGDLLLVDTTIVDPRGDAGSPEGQQAVAVCQAAVDLLTASGTAAPGVQVHEADGTTFAVYSQQAIGNLVPAQQCTEY